MKISNPYNTTIRTNHEQPLESKKIESAEINNRISLESPIIENEKKQTEMETNVPKELQQVINALKNKLPISSEVIQQVTDFMSKSEGTFDQKLETIKMLLNKNLELTSNHLKAIHYALHDKLNLKETIVGQFLEQNKGKENLLKIENIQEGKSANTRITNLNRSLLSGIIKQISQAFQQGKSLEDGLQILQNKIDQNSTHDLETMSKLKIVLSDGINFKDDDNGNQTFANRQGQELFLNKLQELFLQLADVEQQDNITKNNLNTNSTNTVQQEISNPIHLQSKDIIVNTITKRLAEATIQFRDLKRDIARNIDQISNLTSQANKNSYQNVKSLLESAINKLDNAILKSDIVYLTDMKTEKVLIQASSRLAEARVHLDNGNQPKATEILFEVKQTMDHLKWQPSDVKVKHFVAKESLFLEEIDLNNWSTKHSELAKSHSSHEGSARGMFELIRAQGLNHDSEIAQNLAFNKFDSQQDDLQKNMKAVILKVLEAGANEAKNPESRQAAENTLINITGQQLLSKFDSGTNMQSMFFNLPTYFLERLENIKVYVNSKKDGEKIDWENSSLYFLIETKKLGETGILVSSNNRNLSITIKNDHPAIQNKLENIVAKYKDRIQEIGYQVSGIHFKRLNEKDAQHNTAERTTVEKKSTQPEFYNPSKEGYDFRI